MWIIPILFYLPSSFADNIGYATGTGNENGYFCYTVQNRTKVYLSDLQQEMFLATDILVLLTISISICIILWRFKRDVDKTRETQHTDQLYLFRYNIMIQQKQKSLNFSIGFILLSYVLFRLPWIIFADAHAESFSVGMRVAIILYYVKFSAPAVLFAFTNKNYRRAYLDILKMAFPCFCKEQKDNNNANE